MFWLVLRHLGEAADLQGLDLPPPVQIRKIHHVEGECERGRVVLLDVAELDVHCRDKSRLSLTPSKNNFEMDLLCCPVFSPQIVG